jgi:hypothetical protein
MGIVRVSLDPIKGFKIKSFDQYLVEKDSFILEGDIEDREVQARIRVRKAIVWLNINKGFFARLLASLNIYGVTDPRYTTMATNGLNIQYHPDFVLAQSDAAVRFVLCHEILHCVGDHMSRRGNRDPLIWNYACDYAINPILNEEKDSSFAWPVFTDESQGGKIGSRMGLYEEKYLGMTAEEIYDLLVDDPDMQDQANKESGDGGMHVIDSDEDLGQPDSEGSVVQQGSGDEEGEEGKGKGEGEGKEGDKEGEGDGKGQGGDKEGEGGDKEGEGASSMVGKKARITEGPNKGRIGVISAVNADGSVIIDIQ